MDPVISYILAGVIVVVLAAIVYQAFTSKKSNESEPAAVRPRVLPGAELREDLPAGARRRRAGAVDRLRRAREAEAARRQEEDSDASANEEGDLFDYIAQPEGKIGAKKMAKLEEKARKRADREAMERERAEQKEREALLEEERKKEEARLLRLEAKKEEEARIAKEEKEKREYEEYLAMKSQFAIEEEGEDAVMQTDEAELLQQFIDYIKKNKVMVIEDLAAQFNIKTQAAIERIEALMLDGTLTGVLDDRGKFIYITMDELQSVAKFIKQRGRVSIQELAESSNKLIRLTPESGPVEVQ